MEQMSLNVVVRFLRLKQSDKQKIKQGGGGWGGGGVKMALNRSPEFKSSN